MGAEPFTDLGATGAGGSGTVCRPSSGPVSVCSCCLCCCTGAAGWGAGALCGGAVAVAVGGETVMSTTSARACTGVV